MKLYTSTHPIAYYFCLAVVPTTVEIARSPRIRNRMHYLYDAQ
jgi:hypothetical protein